MSDSCYQKEGVYQHFKDGRYYQVLFAGTVRNATPSSEPGVGFDYVPGIQTDDILCVYVGDDGSIVVSKDEPTEGGWGCKRVLFCARAHGPLALNDQVVIYIPLYSHLPGRRISVRLISEFNEPVETVCRLCKGSGLNHEQPGNFCNLCRGRRWTTGRRDLDPSAPKVPRFTYIGDTIR